MKSAEDVSGKAHHQTSIRYSLKLKCRNNLGKFCALNVLCYTVLFSFCPGQSAFEVVFSVVTLAEPDAGIKNRVAMSSKYLDRYRKNSGVNIGQLGFVPVLTMCKYDGEDVFTVVSQDQRTTKPNDNICAWCYKFKDQSDGIAFDILFAYLSQCTVCVCASSSQDSIVKQSNVPNAIVNHNLHVNANPSGTV